MKAKIGLLLLWLAVSLWMTAPATAVVDTFKRGGDGSGSSPVPGVSGTTASEATIGYYGALKSLPGIRNLPVYYLSTGDANTGCTPHLTGDTAGTCLPTGNDANNCTIMAPCLTITRCEQLTTYGRGRCRLDSADFWNAVGEHTGNNKWEWSTTAFCNTPGEACVVIEGSNPADPAEVDCTGLFAGGTYFEDALFKDGRGVASADEWMVIQNITFYFCPALNTGSNQDFFYGAGPGDVVMLNVSVAGINGVNNQLHTSHNATEGQGINHHVAVLINVKCELADWTEAGGTGQCINSAGNAHVIAINSEFGTSTDSANALNEPLVQPGHPNNGVNTMAFAFIGSRFINRAAASAGYIKTAINLASCLDAHDGETFDTFLAFNTIIGFDNTISDAGILWGSPTGCSTNTRLLKIYRTSISDTSNAFLVNYVDATSVADRIEGACLATENNTQKVFSIVGSCAPLYVNVTQITADELVGFPPYHIMGGNYIDQQDFEDGSSAAEKNCRGGPWVWNSTHLNSPFDTFTTSPVCRHGNCDTECTDGVTWTMPAGMYIPRFVHPGGNTIVTAFNFQEDGPLGR